MGRNKHVQCNKCHIKVRSDNLARHYKSCLQGKSKNYLKIKCAECDKQILRKKHLQHKLSHSTDVNQGIIENLQNDQHKFEKEIETGKIVKNAIISKLVDPRSVRKEYRNAIQYHKTDDATYSVPALKPWQEQLLEELKPSERKIYWIVGKQGSEGKSWFGKFLLKTIGRHKVFHSTIANKGDAMLHALSKRELSVIDVFIFNVPKSFDIGDIPYSFLEDLKDGESLSTKYDSKQLTFNVPNIVIVFSNEKPLMYKMSFDRWYVFEIKDDNLW